MTLDGYMWQLNKSYSMRYLLSDKHVITVSVHLKKKKKKKKRLKVFYCSFLFL